MKNLYLLPTGRESKLFENVDNDIFAFSKEAIRWRGEQFLNYNIYITSSTDKSQGYYISIEGGLNGSRKETTNLSTDTLTM